MYGWGWQMGDVDGTYGPLYRLLDQTAAIFYVDVDRWERERKLLSSVLCL